MFCTSSRLTPRPAFTLSEILITLGIIGLIAALTGVAVKINDRLKTEQSKKTVEGALMEVQAAVAKYQASGGALPIPTNNDWVSPAQLLQYLDARPYTGTAPEFNSYAANGTPTSNNDMCMVGNPYSTVCVQLKNGAVLRFSSYTSLRWYESGGVYETPRTGRFSVHSLMIDPDVTSSATAPTDIGKPVSFGLTNTGNVILADAVVNVPSYWPVSHTGSGNDYTFVRAGSSPAQIQTDFASKGW